MYEVVHPRAREVPVVQEGAGRGRPSTDRVGQRGVPEVQEDLDRDARADARPVAHAGLEDREEMNARELEDRARERRSTAVKALRHAVPPEKAQEIVDAILESAKAEAHAHTYRSIESLKRALRKEGANV